ncbi:MAG: DUF1361 domain-containing protein [Patescibacteria group bacterium]
MKKLVNLISGKVREHQEKQQLSSRIPWSKEALWLGSYSVFNLLLLGFRVWFTAWPTYLFLSWNLFLAFIPYALSSFAIRFWPFKKYWPIIISLLVLWLLFFPNAPYILTDFIHLKQRLGIPLWFDALLLTSFSLNGLLFGFLSMMHVHAYIDSHRRNRLVGWLVIVTSLLLSSFGIYLGRFLRWNSWDVFSEPKVFVVEVLRTVFTGDLQTETLSVTLAFFLFMIFHYVLFRALLKGSEPRN